MTELLERAVTALEKIARTLERIESQQAQRHAVRDTHATDGTAQRG